MEISRQSQANLERMHLINLLDLILSNNLFYFSVLEKAFYMSLDWPEGKKEAQLLSYFLEEYGLADMRKLSREYLFAVYLYELFEAGLPPKRVAELLEEVSD